MSQLDILTFPNPRLRNVAKPVAQVDDRIRRYIDDMFETMYAAPGIGLAAIQVDIPLRLVVIDISDNQDQPLCLINPEILWREGEEQMDEGCLSVPGFYEPVTRAERLRVRALDRDGQPFELETGGLLVSITSPPSSGNASARSWRRRTGSASPSRRSPGGPLFEVAGGPGSPRPHKDRYQVLHFSAKFPEENCSTN